MEHSSTFLKIYNYIIQQNPQFKNDTEIYNMVRNMYNEMTSIGDIYSEEARLEVLKNHNPKAYQFVQKLKNDNPSISNKEISQKLKEKYHF